MRAECTPGSRLSVIDLSSHVVHVIITRTLFTLARTTIGQAGQSPTRNRHVHLGNPYVILQID